MAPTPTLSVPTASTVTASPASCWLTLHCGLTYSSEAQFSWGCADFGRTGPLLPAASLLMGQAQEGLGEYMNKSAIQHLTPSHLELCTCVKGQRPTGTAMGTRNKRTPNHTTL